MSTRWVALTMEGKPSLDGSMRSGILGLSTWDSASCFQVIATVTVAAAFVRCS